MKKVFVFLFALTSYALGLGTVVYYADFFVGYGITKSINSGKSVGWFLSLLNNFFLLLLFVLPHSIMARPEIKIKMRQYIPFALERSVYIAVSSVLIIALCYFWQPIAEPIFDARGSVIGTILWIGYGLGWFFTLFSSFLIDHFDLFGLRQAWNYQRHNYNHDHRLVTPLLYKLVRHPIYLGWMMVHWCNPYFSYGQLFMAVFMTIYMFIAMHYEERDLTSSFGEQYHLYRRSTPKIFPFIKRGINS